MTDMLAVGSNVCAVTLTEELVCLDAHSGAERLRFETGSKNEKWFRTSSPASGNGRIYLGTVDGKMFAVDAASGQPVWKAMLSERISTSVTALPSRILAGTADGRVHALDPSDGRVLHVSKVGLNLAPGAPDVDDDLFVYLSLPRQLVALDAELMTLWQRPLPNDASTLRGPIRTRDAVLVGVDDGRILAFRRSDGVPLWSWKLENRASSLTYNDAVLFVGTSKGTVYAIQAAE